MMRGSCALRIWPNCGLFRAVVTAGRPGPPARKLFVKLNASPRTSRFIPSCTLKIRDSAMSIWKKPGPGTLERPELPNVPAGTVVEKAAGLIQQVLLGLAHSGFWRIWLGRSVVDPLN